MGTLLLAFYPIPVDLQNLERLQSFAAYSGFCDTQKTTANKRGE
jgi:hypothetical protein